MAYHQGSRPESEWAVLDYAWDGAGRLATLTHPDGLAVDYNYDVLGRPTSVVEGANTLATVSYDDHGPRASLS